MRRGIVAKGRPVTEAAEGTYNAGTAAVTYRVKNLSPGRYSDEAGVLGSSPYEAELRALGVPKAAWDTYPVDLETIRSMIAANPAPTDGGDFFYPFVHAHRAFDKWRAKATEEQIHKANWTVTLRWLTLALAYCRRHASGLVLRVQELLTVAKLNLNFPAWRKEDASRKEKKWVPVRRKNADATNQKRKRRQTAANSKSRMDYINMRFEGFSKPEARARVMRDRNWTSVQHANSELGIRKLEAAINNSQSTQ